MSSNAAVELLVTVSGDRIVKSTLEQIATKETRRAARKAITSGLSILQRALRAAVPTPTTPGHDGRDFAKSIGSRHKRNSRRGIVEAKVGIGVGKSKYSKAKGNLTRAPHYHLIALGTQNRYTGARTVTRGKKGTRGKVSLFTGNKRMYRGRMDSNPFVYTVASRLDRAVMAHMADVFVEEIEKAAARLSHVAGV